MAKNALSRGGSSSLKERFLAGVKEEPSFVGISPMHSHGFSLRENQCPVDTSCHDVMGKHDSVSYHRVEAAVG